MDIVYHPDITYKNKNCPALFVIQNRFLKIPLHEALIWVIFSENRQFLDFALKLRHCIINLYDNLTILLNFNFLTNAR